ncbi:2-oxoacid dehydrogenases acyltransferase (catalytic domain) [Cryptosporangium aurantiacum]|uniref:Dihydrolipoyllysine-residue succinyltransferase component of 2-oxoglutarate dehydrogenase complex n=2 Tax=Cryptosporangium aurantiacum TaxID=134849 RepID=A0A1M7KG57_9ACTN|nr:2-oxoacid dehydrogenases acyltransferase (catalytic domain) [Cryptosporangium aurantiacum]
MRRIIASRMVESLQTSAQLTSVVEVDVSAVAEQRRRHKDAFRAQHGVGLSYLPYFALATVQALAEHPIVNASVIAETNEIEYHPAAHLGIAVDTDRGLMVPVIHDAGDLDLAGLAVAIDDVAARTRENKLRPDEGSGGTFTITNTGSRGALFDTPIINAPQSAILGTGAVVRRPVALLDGEGAEWVAIRSMVYLALSYDHRIVDGADAARFLTDVRRRLEDPQWADEVTR